MTFLVLPIMVIFTLKLMEFRFIVEKKIGGLSVGDFLD